ncbi:hypothetical protein Y1Q_0005881 [Alligator mississippiensis]|uniref:Uncharacterized protein n=1 Tax=Alligator mississippiensis TaxID=8496 RepID=A0A151NFM4_ALLMI|nr:hypothetical protein Y1Q_0005881 [Alligator mississippiensis]
MTALLCTLLLLVLAPCVQSQLQLQASGPGMPGQVTFCTNCCLLPKLSPSSPTMGTLSTALKGLNSDFTVASS